MTSNETHGNDSADRGAQFDSRHFVDSVLESVGGGWDAGYLTDSYYSSLETLAKLVTTVQPGDVACRSAELAAELMRIMTGESQYTQKVERDPRFSAPAWQDHPYFTFLSRSYVAWSDAVMQLVDDDRAIDWRDREHARMLLQILVTAAAPSNFLMTNPEALEKAIATNGESLVRGLKHLLEDMSRGQVLPSHVSPGSFEVGRDLAATPGAVVFRNEVLELIQYRPTTDEVLAQPTLIIPPQINKFYVMDMAPGRSFVEYVVSHGVPAFIVSWRNPGREHGHWDFDTYIEACLEAVDAVCDISKSEELNLVGVCAGGITATVLLNTLMARGDQRVKAIAYAVTLLDFEVPCPLGAFHSDSLLKMTRKFTQEQGVLVGRDLKNVFSWMRPNDLIWRYWVNNYLLGDDPPAYDVLYWNDDSTNLPRALHQQFLQIFENSVLSTPGELSVLGHPVDLSTIDVDSFVTGAESDHLTPWRGCYRTTQLLKGESTFALINAGHIVGLVNPPGNPRSSLSIGPAQTADPEAWKQAATKRQGTWWEAWVDWISERAPARRAKPRRMGNKRHPILAPAPGTYVMEEPEV